MAAKETDYSGEVMKFVSQLATATGDLSQLTCPSFLLNGYSLLDYSLYWSDHPQYLHRITTTTNAGSIV